MLVIIDGKTLRGRGEYHRYLKTSLNFPEYYGGNLDALYDLLSVIDEPVVLKMKNVREMRIDLGPYYEKLLNTLQDAARVNSRVTLQFCDAEENTDAVPEVDAEVISLQQKSSGIDDFIARHESFIKSRLHHWESRLSGGRMQGMDAAELWSTALAAFSESIKGFDGSKGGFYAFSSLVIERRLTDHYRYAARHRREISIDPALLQANPGDGDPEPNSALGREVRDKLKTEDDDTLALEIDAVSLVISEYGFSFFDLAASSPKAEKTKQACAAAVEYLIDSPLLINEMRASKQLPIKALAKRTGVPRKTLERHRKYIIAATEIIDGDFPGLAGYMRHIRRGKQR